MYPVTLAPKSEWCNWTEHSILACRVCLTKVHTLYMHFCSLVLPSGTLLGTSISGGFIVSIYSLTYNTTFPTKVLCLNSGQAISHYSCRLKPKLFLLWINSVSLTSLLPWHSCLECKENLFFFFLKNNLMVGVCLFSLSTTKTILKILK